MTEREQKANQSLHTLDEAQRLGRITREEYRARRRYVLSTLCDSHGITARNAIVPKSNVPPGSGGAQSRVGVIASGPVAQEEVLSALFPTRSVFGLKFMLVVGIGAVLCVVLLYWLLRAG
ncbi:MAG: hypothetical protein WA777_14275 [Rhodanobacter sp.]